MPPITTTTTTDVELITSGIALPATVGIYGSVANSTSLLVSGNFTVEAWIAPNTAQNGLILSMWRGANAKNNWFLQHQGADNKLQFRVGSPPTSAGEVQINVVSTNAIGAGWHHVAGIFRPGSYLRVYIDGVRDGTNTTGIYDTIKTSDIALIIGGESTGGDPGTLYAGSIDMIRISNSLRYDADFTPPSGDFASDGNTMALWFMDNGSLTDASTNSNNGVNVGTLGFVQGSTFSGGTTTTTTTTVLPFMTDGQLWGW